MIKQYASGKKKPIDGMKGKTMSEEARKKIRQAILKYWKNKRKV